MKIIDKENRIAEICGYVISDDDAWLYDLYEIGYSAPGQTKEAIAELGDGPFTLRINSYGGSVDAGMEIYSLLRDKDVTVEITGMAASIASVIAQAAPKGKLLMSPGAGMMIHRALAGAQGNESDMQKAKEMLESTDRRILAVYMTRTNKTEAEIKSLMDNETFMSAQEAIGYGLADGVSEAKNNQPKLKAVALFGGLSAEKLEALKAKVAGQGKSLSQNPVVEKADNKISYNAAEIKKMEAVLFMEKNRY